MVRKTELSQKLSLLDQAKVRNDKRETVERIKLDIFYCLTGGHKLKSLDTIRNLATKAHLKTKNKNGISTDSSQDKETYFSYVGMILIHLLGKAPKGTVATVSKILKEHYEKRRYIAPQEYVIKLANQYAKITASNKGLAREEERAKSIEKAIDAVYVIYEQKLFELNNTPFRGKSSATFRQFLNEYNQFEAFERTRDEIATSLGISPEQLLDVAEEMKKLEDYANYPYVKSKKERHIDRPKPNYKFKGKLR